MPRYRTIHRCFASIVTLAGALILTSCSERPISPFGAGENNRSQSLPSQQRKTLDPGRMRLLGVKAPRTLHKSGHACSGSKTTFIKAGKNESLDLCHTKLEIPGGALAQDMNLSFSVVDEDLVIVELGPDISFHAPVTMTLSLKVVNLIDIDLSGLTLSRYNAATGEWLDVPSTIDDKKENIAAAITQAGRYALIWNTADGAKETIAWQGEHWGGKKEKMIRYDRGGRLEFHGHAMDIPPFALSESKKMVITEVHKGNAQVDFGPSGWFNKAVTITICFNEVDLTGVDLNNLTITWFDPTTREWIDVGGVVDVKGRKVYVSVWHFTQYSLAVR